eukprot:197207-Amphidinium_carterae.1
MSWEPLLKPSTTHPNQSEGGGNSDSLGQLLGMLLKYAHHTSVVTTASHQNIIKCAMLQCTKQPDAYAVFLL